MSEFGERYINPDLKFKTPKGLLVGTKVKNIKGNGIFENIISDETVVAIYYDYRGRVIQNRSINHMGGLDVTYTAYDFSGNPIKILAEHTLNGAKITELYTYVYDNAGRLIETKHKLNDGTEISLAQNTYDELGRLKETVKGGNSDLNQSYHYDVRSQITKIRGFHFHENLDYTYGGNISSMEWGQASTWRSYTYTYDNLSRLKTAAYAGPGNENYNTAYNYDKHGNITYLERWGKDNISYGAIDKLALEYTGNQLKKITDTGNNVSLSASEDFKDWANQSVEYTFNKNGALVKDLNKGITKIEYNSLNLPETLEIKNPHGEGRNEYLYSATGQKLRVIQRYNSAYNSSPVIGSDVNLSVLDRTKTTDYLGNKIYENGNLKRILIDEGYIENGIYHFFLNDHLGNNKLVYSLKDWYKQGNHYYPFGGTFADSWDGNSQPYKYNGKEEDKLHNLNLYDYGARMYDPSIGRFHVPDRFAEKYYNISPYAYRANNPIKFIDVNGDSICFSIDNNVATLNFTAKMINMSNDNINMGAAIKDITSSINKAFKGASLTIDGKEYALNVNAQITSVSSMADVADSDHLFVMANGSDVAYGI